MNRSKPTHFRNSLDLRDKVQVKILRKRLKLTDEQFTSVLRKSGCVQNGDSVAPLQAAPPKLAGALARIAFAATPVQDETEPCHSLPDSLPPLFCSPARARRGHKLRPLRRQQRISNDGFWLSTGEGVPSRPRAAAGRWRSDSVAVLLRRVGR